MAKKIGNYNENLASVYKIISDDPLILKLLTYDNDTDVLDGKELSSAEKSKIRKEHIFNVKQVERYSVDNGVYISIEQDLIDRKTSSRLNGSSHQKYYTNNYMYIYITCSSMLLDAANGNRILSLEYAIEKALTDANINSLYNCTLGNSFPDRAIEGYGGRVIPLFFVDKNDSGWGNE
ncbi:MAG: hypothetical protein ACRC1P_11445 [Cellulosilyticaceae bacterium]